MYFELNGKTFAIKFYRAGTTTSAELFSVKERGGMIHLGVFGLAKLHITDRFVKKVGRIVALTHLLEGLSGEWMSENEEDPREFILTREDRKIIWEAYFKTHKK